MLLESITLENFRQFRHESIDFAQGENGKNVTIIIGENGTGKTTFAQAFFWCMYGETEFSDKNMLNKLVANEMKPGQECKVQVTLKLRHGDVSYTLMREQTYWMLSEKRIGLFLSSMLVSRTSSAAKSTESILHLIPSIFSVAPTGM